MARPKGVFFVEYKPVRFSDETLKRAKMLMRWFPEDYSTFSDVVRSGVNALFLKRKKEGDMYGCKTNRRKTQHVS